MKYIHDFITIDENVYPSSFEPAEQLSLNYEGRFTLTKVLQLRCEVKQMCDAVSTVAKILLTS